MFKDFSGFKIDYSERRLKLGIEIVMSHPYDYFAYRKSHRAGFSYGFIKRWKDSRNYVEEH